MMAPYPLSRLRPWLTRLLLLAVAWWAGGPAQAQSLTRLEYFFDTDPGYGLGQQVAFPTAQAAQDYSYTASLAGLAPGYHTLYTRVLEQRPQEVNPRGPLGPFGASAYAGEPNYLPARKAWSIAHVRPVYVGPVGPVLNNLTYLEYFFDTDPGYRLGHQVSFPTPGTSVDHTYLADLSGLAPGFHTMYTRVRNAAGAWSISHVRPIYVGPTSGAGSTAPNLTYAEYYVDTDPGYRLGTRVNFATPGASVDQNFTADLSGVSNGVHTLYVRVRNAAGAWSLVTLKPFLRSGVTATSPALNLTRAEYYLDTDPGFGRATAVPITPGTSIDQNFTADLSGVANGFHTLYVRVMDASKAWSIVNVRPFVRQGSIAGSARPLITKVRYQVFPGSSNVASSPPEYYVLPVPTRAADVDVTFPTNVCVTAAGSYIMRVAALDANGVPAIEYAHPFTVATPSKVNPNLPAALVGCTGQPLTITSASAGAGGTYQWSRNGSPLTGETSQSLTVTTTATYAVAVTTNQGCTGTGSTNVTFSPSPTVSLPPVTDVPCAQASTVLDAGAGYSTYLWSPGGATTQTLTVSAPGTYSVTVTGASTGSCTATASTLVRMPKATIQQASQRICSGQSLTLTLATPTNGSIVWQANGTTISGQTGTSLVVSPTATTTYTALVSDQGWSCSDAITISVDAPVTLSLPADSSPACGTSSVTLDAGPGAAIYAWSPGGQTTRTITVSSPGTYSVTGTNGSCSATASTQVFMPDATVVGGGTQRVCAGQPLTLSLAGPVNGTVLWSTGAATNSITVTPAASTTYSATVSAGGHSCTATVSVAVDSIVVYNRVQNQCLLSDPITSTGSGRWQRLKIGCETVAAINDQGRVLGTVRVEFSVMNGPTRQDGRGTKYLDRNWHLISQNPLGAGNSALVRFYGLTTEFNKLRADDPANVTSSNSLRLTQYSGLNEDCDLSNNVTAGSDTRLLLPVATSYVNPDYFVVQATVTDHFSEFYVNGGNRPLPVELTRFTATRQGRDVLTQWATASEKNSAYFAVEAAASPRDGFLEFGRVPAAGSSSAPRSYALAERDVPATGGLRYYRLRQTDLDGTTSYSPVAVVRLDQVSQSLRLTAQPNPFHQAELQVRIDAPAAGPGILRLTDLAGRTLLSREVQLSAGTTTVALPELAALPTGVYVLTLRAGAELRQQKVLKE